MTKSRWLTALATWFAAALFAVPLLAAEMASAQVPAIQPATASATVSVDGMAAYDAQHPPAERGPRSVEKFRPLPFPAPKSEPGPPPLFDNEAEKALGGLPAPPLVDNFLALPDGGAVPPDTNGAVGPNHLMVALNDRVRFMERDGDVLSTVSLTAFWSSLGVTEPFDPKTVFDPLSHRFLFVCVAQKRSSANSVLLGVSASADPAGLWHLSRFDTDPANVVWADFSYIGASADKITFTTNLFAIANDDFTGSRIFIADKLTALSGPLGSVTTVDAPLTPAYAPCLTFDGGEDTQHLVRVASPFMGTLELARITGVAAAPDFTVRPTRPVSANWNGQLPDAPQPGTPALIETNDSRIQNAVLRDGELWCVHNAGYPAFPEPPAVVGAKWWRVDPASAATVAAGAVVDSANEDFLYFPSIAVNATKQVLIGFTMSSATRFPSAAYVYREAGAPASVSSAPEILKAGEGAYTVPRWGDYSTTAVDPVNDTTFWTLQMYAAGADTWGTWWGRIDPPAIPTLSTGGPRLLAALVCVIAAVALTYGLHRARERRRA